MFKRLRQLIREWRGVIIAAPSTAGLLIVLRLAGFLQLLEWVALDSFFRLRPLEPADSRIVIVGIYESDIQKLGHWPLSDAAIARAIENIKQQQPRAIGLDIYRDLRVEPGYANLVKVFKTTPNLIGVKQVDQDGELAVKPPPELNKLGQVGANNLVLDPDGKIRRGLLYLETKDGEAVASLGLRLALIYLEREGIVPEHAAVNPDYLQLNRAVFARLQANDGGYANTYTQGYQILMNFRGPKNSFQMVSVTDVLENRVPPHWARDRVVLIGSTAPSLQDLFYTPYDTNLVAAPTRTAGVEIHAHLTSQIISAALNERPLIKVWSEPLEGLWILFWSGVGAALAWKWRYAKALKNFSFQRNAILIFSVGTIVASGFVAFWWGWWIPVVPPLLALGGSAAAITVYIARAARKIRQAFGRYMSDEIAATLLDSPDGLKLGGERRKITLLTSDLRGFTATSERLPPCQVLKIINFYLGYMTEAIARYEGTIDEFMGDGILVLFGATIAREDDAKRAVACAVAMQQAMQPVNKKMKEWGLPPLEMGIGINTGEVVVGNIGSEKRAKYGVVGSQVNLTYRIESYTVGGQIFISESTLKETGAIVKIDGQMALQPKGVQEPINVCEIGGIGGEYNLFLDKEENIFFPLPEAIPLQYAVLDGKQVGNAAFKGSLVALAAKEALVKYEEVQGQGIPPVLTNIKFNLFSPRNLMKAGEDIYAKVVGTCAEERSFYICFTSLPPDVEARLKSAYSLIEMRGNFFGYCRLHN